MPSIDAMLRKIVSAFTLLSNLADLVMPVPSRDLPSTLLSLSWSMGQYLMALLCESQPCLRRYSQDRSGAVRGGIRGGVAVAAVLGTLTVLGYVFSEEVTTLAQVSGSGASCALRGRVDKTRAVNEAGELSLCGVFGFLCHCQYCN